MVLYCDGLPSVEPRALNNSGVNTLLRRRVIDLLIMRTLDSRFTSTLPDLPLSLDALSRVVAAVIF